MISPPRWLRNLGGGKDDENGGRPPSIPPFDFVKWGEENYKNEGRILIV
jgi:hypothetical protein